MADLWYVKGEGGVIWTMTPPLSEGIADRLTKGYLVRVNEDGTKWRDPEDDAPTSSAPAKNAAKAEWVGWAVHNGMTPDDAEAATKQDLIDQFGG